MNYLDNYLNRVATEGLEAYRQFYGKYRAIVARNDDPEGRGRIQVRACAPLDLGANEVFPEWLEPSTHSAGPNRGFFWPPEIGDGVNVVFDRGRPDTPIKYEYGWHAEQEMPAEFAYTALDNVSTPSDTLENAVPDKRGFITRAGHSLIFSDEEDNQQVKLTWKKPADDSIYRDRTATADRGSGDEATLLFDAEGTVTLAAASGARMVIDGASGSVTVVNAPESGTADVLTMDDEGFKVVLRDGGYLSFTESGVQVVTPENVTLTGKSLTADTGSTFLSKGLREPVIKGRSYNIADQTKHQARKLAYAGLVAQLGALGAPPAASAPVTGGTLAPLAQYFAQIIAAETAYDSTRELYLSRVTESA